MSDSGKMRKGNVHRTKQVLLYGDFLRNMTANGTFLNKEQLNHEFYSSHIMTTSGITVQPYYMCIKKYNSDYWSICGEPPKH